MLPKQFKTCLWLNIFQSGWRCNGSCVLTLCVPSGEALGAIGDPVVLDLLREYVKDPVIEVGSASQCCQDFNTTLTGSLTSENGSLCFFLNFFFKAFIFLDRSQRLVSWPCVVWSGCSAAINCQKTHRWTKTPTAPWTRRHLQSEETCRSSGAACWTRRCHSLIGTGPCLRSVMSALRRLCWLWETVRSPVCGFVWIN